MIQGNRKIFAAVALLACGLASQVHAQDAKQGCILLKSTAEVAKEVVDAKGVKTVKMVPADKVVPGAEVTWSVSASNICKQPSENVTINNPVPAHMSYVSGTAFGAGSVITFSVDGKTFGSPQELTVTENGATRPAKPDEYKHIRWVFKDPLAPGATAVARFRALLN